MLWKSQGIFLKDLPWSCPKQGKVCPKNTISGVGGAFSTQIPCIIEITADRSKSSEKRKKGIF
jgi:hypothetical protein